MVQGVQQGGLSPNAQFVQRLPGGTVNGSFLTGQRLDQGWTAGHIVQGCQRLDGARLPMDTLIMG
jgi:hypothetical protein